jgi:hypothetical protein
MSPIGHFAAGLAAKPLAPKVPLYALLFATLVLDFLYFAFAYAGMEGAKSGIPWSHPWSHGLFMSVIWSGAAGLLAARIYRDYRAGAVVGLLVFSHWALDFISHPMGLGHPLPPDMPLLFHGSRKVGLGLYNSISLFQAISIEVGMFILGAAVYFTYTVKERRKRRPKSA